MPFDLVPQRVLRIERLRDDWAVNDREVVKKELGITAAMKPFRFWTNAKRRIKRKVSYESEAGRLIRKGLPRPGGCLVVVLAVIGVAMAAVVMAKQ